ncbi:hypothetical protein WMF26_33610 [Sorangium sp. So ce185]|uniref:hypothetical protein n=1 Tax=Sorangium sp. So ce185 TaxID=3133287 RepID=UPI003F614579
MKAFNFAAILVSVCAMAACTVTDGSGDGGEGGTGGEGGAGTTTTTTTSGTGGEGGEGGEGGGGVCAEESAATCQTCCDEELPDESALIMGYIFSQCGCAADSPCADVCDTTDATTDSCSDEGGMTDVTNPDCVMCLNELEADAPCYEAAATDCEGDEDCSPYFECLSSCSE